MAYKRPHLKKLGEIVRAHGSGRPDLALLARELGAVVHRHSLALADELDALRRAERFERWRLGAHRGEGAEVLIMVWPPNHATPVHDHAGLWGLEMALYGALSVENWQRGPDGSLSAGGRQWLGPGDACWFEDAASGLHRCRNLSRQACALSLHVYGGRLEHYLAYAPTPQAAWRTRRQRARVIGQLA